MPTYGYFCKACDETYEVRMSVEEKGKWVPRCPMCGGGEGKQELFRVAPDGGKQAGGGCCGSGRSGCCG